MSYTSFLRLVLGCFCVFDVVANAFLQGNFLIAVNAMERYDWFGHVDLVSSNLAKFIRPHRWPVPSSRWPLITDHVICTCWQSYFLFSQSFLHLFLFLAWRNVKPIEWPQWLLLTGSWPQRGMFSLAHLKNAVCWQIKQFPSIPRLLHVLKKNHDEWFSVIKCSLYMDWDKHMVMYYILLLWWLSSQVSLTSHSKLNLITMDCSLYIQPDSVPLILYLRCSHLGVPVVVQW